MGFFGTTTNPSHYVEIVDPLVAGQVKRPAAGLVIKARDHLTGAPLADIVTGDYGYWTASFPGIDLIEVSGDGGTTWIGPLQSSAGLVASTQSGALASAADAKADSAVATAQAALLAAQNGPPATWSNISGIPATFPPSAHTHTTGQVGATPVGKALLDAVDAQAARVAIGAGTGNGTSNLVLGTTAGTAAAGNHVHQASGISFAPTASIPDTDVQAAIVRAASMGGSGGGGGGAILPVLYAAGAYPAQAASPPAGVSVRLFMGPTQYVGPTWAGVVDLYHYAALT